jgi:hypothetical protein
MSMKQRLVNAVAVHTRFAIICVCIMIMIWASSGQALVSNRSLAYPIVIICDDGKTEYECGSMECTEEIVHNNQCEICTKEFESMHVAMNALTLTYRLHSKQLKTPRVA